MNLIDKVVIVTGGANGIGKALCERFHQEGARKVVVLDLEEENARRVADSIEGEAFGVDVRDESQIAAAVAEVESAHGQVDLFCSNAGIVALDGPPWWATSASNATWEAMWDIHVMSHVYAARACLPRMLERGSGYFLNTSSAAGLLLQIGDAAYTTTKHAAIGFAESLRVTHGDDGIGVSVLCPQAVATRMVGDSDGFSAGVDGLKSPEDVALAVVQGLDAEEFLILPHPEVQEYRRRKAGDYDRWLNGMRRLRRTLGEPTIGGTGLGANVIDDKVIENKVIKNKGDS